MPENTTAPTFRERYEDALAAVKNHEVRAWQNGTVVRGMPRPVHFAGYVRSDEADRENGDVLRAVLESGVATQGYAVTRVYPHLLSTFADVPLAGATLYFGEGASQPAAEALTDALVDLIRDVSGDDKRGIGVDEKFGPISTCGHEATSFCAGRGCGCVRVWVSARIRRLLTTVGGTTDNKARSSFRVRVVGAGSGMLRAAATRLEAHGCPPDPADNQDSAPEADPLAGLRMIEEFIATARANSTMTMTRGV